MMKDKFRKSVHIKASPERVWDTLVNPEKIKEYMFGSITRSDWKPGSPVEFYLRKENQEKLVVKGHVIKATPPIYLEHTLFPALSEIKDVPENYLNVVYKIEPEEKGSVLTIIQKGFSTAEKGNERYNDTVKGWEMALPKLITVAET